MDGRLQKLHLSIALLLCVFSLTALAASPKIYRKKLTASIPINSSNSNANKVIPREEWDTTRALIKTAKALARSHSTSEVLTLNLTNLLILVVLKAIIFGIGLFYFGGVSFKSGHGGGHGGWSRSDDGRSLKSDKSSSYMSQSELLLMMTYVLGATEGNFDCLNRVACEDSKKAKEYLNAAKMVLKGAKFAQK